MFTQEDDDEAFFNRILDEFAKDELTDEEVEASYQRFLKRPIVQDPVTGRYSFPDRLVTRTVGNVVENLRALLEMSPARFAMRFGISVGHVAALELSRQPMQGAPEEVAKAVGVEVGLGPLKVLRVFREFEAHRIAAEDPDEGPALLAARKGPTP
jgi:transcriptional regulator with XRE-family HTH domain